VPIFLNSQRHGAPPEEITDAGEGLFSVLWSDVGERFYRSAGPGGEGGGWEKWGAISSLTIWVVGYANSLQTSPNTVVQSRSTAHEHKLIRSVTHI